jgi:nicotinic acid mononucleotide adenylyltransferase
MFSEPSELTMDIRITFPNRVMCNAFVEALYKVGYSPEDVLIRYHSVFFVFDKPHTEQPESRSNLTEYLVQKSNKLYCETYEYITRDYQTTLDKLQYLKVYSPKMFSTVMNMGSDKDLFRHFNVLKSYEGKRG